MAMALGLYECGLTQSYKDLPAAFYTDLTPQPVRAPVLTLLNAPLVLSLGLDPAALATSNNLNLLAGNLFPASGAAIAQAYAGHQFGHFTQLGDGRALLLGELQTPDGQLVDIQLKGSGPTPYARRGDGRAALAPMLREYLISEAMHGLGIPTTRSLAVVATGEPVYRETAQPGAILTRIAASHIRVGTFEYAARVEHALRACDVRVTTDMGNDRIQAKVKVAAEEKIPYMLIVGPRDAEQNAVSLRVRGNIEEYDRQ